MAFQISEVTRPPYFISERMERFRRDVQDRLSSVLNGFATRTSASLKTLGCIAYLLFFAWQVIGLILFTIRAFETSISAKHASFQQTHIELFSHSENLELIWLVTWFLNTALVMIALSKVPSFLGYTVILRKLVRLPSFWSLVALTAVAMAGYPMILAIKNHSGIEVALIVAFMVDRPVQVILLVFLNFIQVNNSRQNGTFKVFVFIKMNVFLLFVTYFIRFVLGSMEFALKVYGIDEDIGFDPAFYTVLGTIRQFAVVMYHYRIYVFYWEKLFVDNRNILDNHKCLENSRGGGDVPLRELNPV